MITYSCFPRRRRTGHGVISGTESKTKFHLGGSTAGGSGVSAPELPRRHARFDGRHPPNRCRGGSLPGSRPGLNPRQCGIPRRGGGATPSPEISGRSPGQEAAAKPAASPIGARSSAPRSAPVAPFPFRDRGALMAWRRPRARSPDPKDARQAELQVLEASFLVPLLAAPSVARLWAPSPPLSRLSKQLLPPRFQPEDARC